MGKTSKYKKLQKWIKEKEKIEKKTRKREINKSIRRSIDLSDGSFYKKISTRFDSFV